MLYKMFCRSCGRQRRFKGYMLFSVVFFFIIILVFNKYLYEDNDNEKQFFYDDSIVQGKKSLNEINRLNNIFDDNIDIDNDDILLKKYEQMLEDQDNPFYIANKDRYTDFSNFESDIIDTVYTHEELLPLIDGLNEKQIVYNDNIFNQPENDFLVIVVQVHKRIQYFKELLDSLQRAKGIENVLLVISNDFYSDQINELVRMVKFCKVIQIFFPYSIQLYPESYPGPSKNDCPRDISREEASDIGCINAESPDMYNHYREAKFTITKHHWWWKINMVMDGLNVTKENNGPFMFIEEDHYVAPSFYVDLMNLHQTKMRSISFIGHHYIIIWDSLYIERHGIRSRDVQRTVVPIYADLEKVHYPVVENKYRNRAMIILVKMFCTFDDYNWDWSLLHTSLNCLPKPLTVLVYEIPRIFHIGDCGVHSGDCNNQFEALIKAKSIIYRNRAHLFAKEIVIEENMYDEALEPEPNGGWGDDRDHNLCRSFVRLTELLNDIFASYKSI